MKYYPLTRNYTYSEELYGPVNKVVADSKTLIDLTIDTIDESKVLDGYTFHLPNGRRAIGKANSSLLDTYFPIGIIVYTGSDDISAYTKLGGTWKRLELTDYSGYAYQRTE